MHTSRQQKDPKIWILVGVLALLGGAVARYYRHAGRESTEGDGPMTPAGETSPTDSLSNEQQRTRARAFGDRLVRAGWKRPAADAVSMLNADFFAIVAETDASRIEQFAQLLEPLGRRPELMQLLVRRPETAGLLASAADPSLIAASLSNVRRYNAAANVFARHAADASEAAEALGRHGALITHLIDEGMVGAETVFLYPRDSAGAEAYDQWLSEAFYAAMSDESRLAAMFQLAMIQGEAIRRRMIDDADFRRDLPAVAWPRLQRLVDSGDFALELAALDANLFQLLCLPSGEQLVRRWGMLPLELLYGDAAYPEPLRDQLVETMLAGDNATLGALVQYGKEPLLASLLERRDISPQVKAAALAKLDAVGSDYPALLQRYSELGSAAALADEVGPAPQGPVTWLPLYYTVYEVPKKILQGRNPTLMEATIAVLDPVFLFLGPLGPDDAVKVAGQQSVRAATRKTAATAASRTLTTAAKRQAAQRIGAGAAVGARESAPWLVSQMLRGSRHAVQRKLQSSMTVDITGPTRMLLGVTGAGQRSLRQLTRLEGRLLMRPDRRVLVRLDRLLVAHPAGRFLAETAVAGMVETSMEVPEVADAAVRAARAAEEFPDSAAALRGEFSAWQQNMSAWWLAEAAGMWDELADQSEPSIAPVAPSTDDGSRSAASPLSSSLTPSLTPDPDD